MEYQRIAVGTAQFGMKYGVANSLDRVSDAGAQKILRCAQDCGIKTLDTASSYGVSEECLGKAGVNEWEIVSKIPAIPKPTDKRGLHIWFSETLQRSLARLRVNSIYGLLVHEASDLNGQLGDALYALMKSAKDKEITRKIGVSVYHPKELDGLIDRYPIDLVQLPFNVLDQRFAESGWLERLQRANIEIHSRSVYLQGLLLMPAKTRPKKFLRWPKLWQQWDGWITESGLSPLATCLSAVFKQTMIDRVIIGFDNLDQFEKLRETKIQPEISLPVFSEFATEELINPSKWNTI